MSKGGRPRKPEGEKLVVLTAAIPPVYREAIDRRAHSEGRTVSDVVREILSRYFHTKKPSATRDGPTLGADHAPQA